MHCRIFSSFPGLYPLDASCQHHPKVVQPKMSPNILKGPWWGGGGESQPWLRTTEVEDFSSEACSLPGACSKLTVQHSRGW